MEGLTQGTWNPARRCTATSQSTGERCQRQPIPGGTVCAMHGGSIPQVQAAAKMRLVAMVEPVLGAFEEILEAWRGTRCPTCNRPTGDAAPVVQVGRIVLDRAGFHPKLTIEREPPPPDPYAGATEDQLIERLEQLLKRCYANRDFRRGLKEPEAQDAVLIGDGFEVPEGDETRSIPPGEPPIEDPNA